MSRSLGYLAVLILLAPAGVRADHLALTFVDPLGDSTGRADVIGMTMTFDADTGAYEIVLTADGANPFSGDFRININLFNPDTGTVDQNPSFFEDTFNDFDLPAPLTTIRLAGTNERLISWRAGDRVATTSEVFGNPSGVTLFRSAVGDFPLGPPGVREDIIAQGNTFATVSAVPEPESVASLGLGLACVVATRRHRRRVAAVSTEIPG